MGFNSAFKVLINTECLYFWLFLVLFAVSVWSNFILLQAVLIVFSLFDIWTRRIKPV